MVTSGSGASESGAAFEVQFVGRHSELAELCALVAAPDVEIVELVGEPGVGKSRLARQLLEALGPRARDVAVVDDAHLLDPCDRERRVDAVRAPGRTVVITDRRARAGTAVPLIVCALPVPDDYSLLDVDAAMRVPSIELLVAFRRTVQPSFVLDAATLPSAARLCAHFRGVPRDLRVASTLLTAVDADLAVSPAAARSPTVLALLTQFRVDHGLGDAADIAGRLSPDARRVLAGAALGVDGLGRQALARITGLREARLTRATSELSDCGVLVGSGQPSAGPGGLVLARFHVPVTALPLVAAVTSLDLPETAAERCTDHHLDVVERALAAVESRNQAAGFAILHAEWANVVAALDDIRARDPARAVDVVLGLRTYWRALGLAFDVQEQVESLTEHEHLLDSVHAARLDLALADAEARLGEPELAAESLQRARAILTDAELPDVLVTQGVLDLTTSTAADESPLLAGAAALRRAGRPAEADRAVSMVALHALFDGRPTDGAALCAAILPDARRRADHLTSGAALLRLSACHAALDDAVVADEYWSRAVVHLRQLGFAVALGQIAEIVGSCMQHSSKARGVRVTELIGAMVDERRAVSTGLDEPAFVVGGFEQRMVRVLGAVDFAAAWTHGRATTPAALVADIARAAVAGGTTLTVAPVVVDRTVAGHGSTGVTEIVGAAAVAIDEKEFSRWSDLTPREAEVALLVAQGLPNREAARRLSISEWTVVNHMRGVLKKLGLRSRVQLARWVAERAAAHAGTAAGRGAVPVPAADPA